jgi:hypothetical protein
VIEMTVGELREAIRDVPDNYEIIAGRPVRDGERYPFVEAVHVSRSSELVRIRTEVCEEKQVVLTYGTP